MVAISGSSDRKKGHPALPAPASRWQWSGLEGVHFLLKSGIRVPKRDMRNTRDAGQIYAENSRLRVLSWAFRRRSIEECICETRDSDKSSVAPISFIVISS